MLVGDSTVILMGILCDLNEAILAFPNELGVFQSTIERAFRLHYICEKLFFNGETHSVLHCMPQEPGALKYFRQP